jgi:hypothetical protein
MTQPLPTSGILDNHRRCAVADFLRAKIQSGSQLSIVSAYFTIYAYDAASHTDFSLNEFRLVIKNPEVK